MAYGRRMRLLDGPAPLVTERRRFAPGTSTRLPALLVRLATDPPESVALRFFVLDAFFDFVLPSHVQFFSRPGNLRLSLQTVGICVSYG